MLALEKVVESAKTISSEELTGIPPQLEFLDQEIKHQKDLATQLLGIEETAKRTLGINITKLEKKEQQLKAMAMFGSKFLRLSTEPLGWRDGNGWPRLVIFPLNDSSFVMSAEVYRNRFWNILGDSDLIDAIRNWKGKVTTFLYPDEALVDFWPYYQDVLDRLKATTLKRNKTLRLSCQFDGVIPSDVRVKIKSCLEMITELRPDCEPTKHIFLIAEPSEWKLQESKPKAIKVDPLVVVWIENTLWLVDDFETTAIEEAMVFTPANQ